MMKVDVDEFERMFPDEAACLTHVAKVRFGPDLRCPHCENGLLRRCRTRPKRLICKACQRDCSIGQGTVFDHCRGSFRDLLYLMLIMANSSATVSISFVERHFGVSRMAAYRMLMVIRAHLAASGSWAQRGGPGMTVHIDETWCPTIRQGGRGARRGLIVFGIIDEGGVNAQVVASRQKSELLPIITKTVRPGSLVVTDQLATYRCLGGLGFKHVALNHSRGEWSNGAGQSSSMIESYWTSLKHFLRFANGSIQEQQFGLYLAEHVFKFNAARSAHCAFRQMIGAFPRIDRELLPQAIDFARYRRLGTTSD